MKKCGIRKRGKFDVENAKETQRDVKKQEQTKKGLQGRTTAGTAPQKRTHWRQKGRKQAVKILWQAQREAAGTCIYQLAPSKDVNFEFVEGHTPDGKRRGRSRGGGGGSGVRRRRRENAARVVHDHLLMLSRQPKCQSEWGLTHPNTKFVERDGKFAAGPTGLSTQDLGDRKTKKAKRSGLFFTCLHKTMIPQGLLSHTRQIVMRRGTTTTRRTEVPLRIPEDTCEPQPRPCPVI
ncbi:hypothetical protein RUM43_013526 [Polyplax serrata]|uniref:Uncharacterized protein n=1 Tax=Polyplax serrata TaxID=468196 RepID=A0AAN8P245_POLSC